MQADEKLYASAVCGRKPGRRGHHAVVNFDA